VGLALNRKAHAFTIATDIAVTSINRSFWGLKLQIPLETLLLSSATLGSIAEKPLSYPNMM